MQRCPSCKNRLVKVDDGAVQFFFRHAAINKSTGELIVQCYTCNKPVTADKELRKALRASVLLLSEK